MSAWGGGGGGGLKSQDCIIPRLPAKDNSTLKAGHSRSWGNECCCFLGDGVVTRLSIILKLHANDHPSLKARHSGSSEWSVSRLSLYF